MKPAPFEYLAPGSLTEALDLMAIHAGAAKALAGGQSLMPLMNFRLARPGYLVDLNPLSELSRIELAEDRLVLGAMVRQRTVEKAPLVAERVPILKHAVSLIGHPAIRHRGTIGGSLAHADPAAELPALMLALEADFVTRKADGRRSIPAGEFFLDVLTTPLEPDELLCEIRVPIPQPESGWSFLELSRRHGDFAIAAVAVLLTLDGGAIRQARISFAGLGPVPVRARRAEELLAGEAPDETLFSGAAELAATETSPTSDIHASEPYRRHLAAVLCRRALVEASQRANGGLT